MRQELGGSLRREDRAREWCRRSHRWRWSRAAARGFRASSANASSFRLAQFRELLGHVRDRAMVLADLHARCRPAGWTQRIPTAVKAPAISSAVVFHVLTGGVDRRFDVADDRLDPTSGEVLDCRVAADLTQVPHRGTGQIVVGVAEPGTADCGELERLRGTAPTALPPARRCGGLRLHPTRSARRGGVGHLRH